MNRISNSIVYILRKMPTARKKYKIALSHSSINKDSTLTGMSQKNADLQSFNEVWFIFRSKLAGCAAFVYAQFLVITQLQPETCNSVWWGAPFDCPLRTAMVLSALSSILWFVLFIVGVTYDHYGEKAHAFLFKTKFNKIWGFNLLLASIGSVFSIAFLFMHFSENFGIYLLVFVLFNCILIVIHELWLRNFLNKSRS